MMLKVKSSKLVLILCSLFLVALVSCKGEDPFVDPGDVEDPQWKEDSVNNMTSSMTAIVKINFQTAQGTLAAFIGDKCCGIGKYVDELCYLYISPATEEGGNVQLRFYSPSLKRIFVAKETFPYVNDSNLGKVAEPYTPEWVVAK